MKLFAVALLSTASSIALAASITYVEAKANADRDEASLGKDAGPLMESQGKVLGPVLTGCLQQTGGKDLSPFVLVMELDSDGRILHTWRQGGSDLSACFERGVAGKQLVAPPTAPFFTSFDMHFTK